VRETLEETRQETGLRIRATGVIGSRIYPRTGVPMVYVAAVLASEAEVQVRATLTDSASCELTEVRRISLAVAGELMRDMSETVHQYIGRTLRS
jgi:hypothetical protein